MRLVFAGVPSETPAGVVRVTLHSALLHANAIGTAAANASAAWAGRERWTSADRAIAYRAAGEVLQAAGYGHVYEEPRT